jgi:hypothetical protein
MTEPVVVHHGREVGRFRSQLGAAVCCNGLLGSNRFGRRCASVTTYSKSLVAR